MSAPTPDEVKARIAALFDRSSETYDQVGVEYFSAFGRRLVSLAELRPGEHVLDLGSGRGAVTFAAAEAVGPEGSVLGIDLAPGMVSRAAADAAGRGLANVSFRVGDAEAPDVPEGSFDAVLAGLVVFFLPDPLAALRRYRALLRPGGRLGLTTFPPQPEDSGWALVGKAIQRYLPDMARTARPDAGPLASPDALAAALRDAGFSSSRTSTEPFDTAFRDADHWWQWAWSHGQRAALERVPADELDALRAECVELLAPETRDDGSIALRQLITYTIATA
jgi:ubiquinone/menaquinone biosynthesis C-methylase UbiE